MAQAKGVEIAQGKDQSVTDLINKLNDPHVEVRRHAAVALGNSYSEAAVFPLIAALKDSDPEVRSHAAWALGRLRPKTLGKAVSDLTILLNDSPPKFSITFPNGEVIVVESSLSNYSETNVPHFIADLKDSDSKVRSHAAWWLGEIYSHVKSPWLATIRTKDPDGGGYKNAARALEEIYSKTAIPALTSALKDSDVEVRKNVARALGKVHSEVAIPALTSALKDSDVEVRKNAAWALGKVHSEVAIPALTSALKDLDSGVRSHAAWALGRIRSEFAFPMLTIALKDPDGEVRSTAAWALGEIYSKAAVPTLIAALRDSAPGVRSSAALALGDIHSEAAIPALISTFKDLNFSVRSNATVALGELHSAGIGNVAGSLVKTLQKAEDPILRGVLIDNLQWYTNPLVTAALVERLETQTETLINRYRAINGLTHQHQLQNLAASRALLETLSTIALRNGEDRFVRYGAFLLLSGVNTPETRHLLDAHKAEFLDLAEANYAVNLPFYLPEVPVHADPPDPFKDPNLIAFNPYNPPNSLFPVIPSIPQGTTFPAGANPRDTGGEVTALLAGKPAICRFSWIAKYWSRCHDK